MSQAIVQETKRGRFVRIAERRVNYILDNLNSLEKCSNKGNYDYSSEDIRNIFDAIETEIKRVKASFNENSRGERKKFRLEG
ncbi:MAG: hypothetical protein RX318_07645 [bacterium]|nr:hypothetical protein [bacterium]